MTHTRYAAQARTARPDLLALLVTRPLWNLEQFRTSLNLEAPVVQYALEDLLAQGEIRTRFVAPDSTARPEPHYSLNQGPPAGLPRRKLSMLEEQLLAFLIGRKETLGNLCTALAHPKLQIIHALAWLDEQELITCTFIGHLPIFSLLAQNELPGRTG